jgi:hypothetical protein
MSWEQVYNFFGIKDFIYFISSPEIQELLFPVKIVFIFFGIFFFLTTLYFLRVSSYLKYYVTEDVVEFLSWRAFGLDDLEKRIAKIKKKAVGGTEAELKLAIIEADDFLSELLEDKEIEGKIFEEIIKNAGRVMVPDPDQVLAAHRARNSVVYEPDFKLDPEYAKRILAVYESAIRNIGNK